MKKWYENKVEKFGFYGNYLPRTARYKTEHYKNRKREKRIKQEKKAKNKREFMEE